MLISFKSKIYFERKFDCFIQNSKSKNLMVSKTSTAEGLYFASILTQFLINSSIF